MDTVGDLVRDLAVVAFASRHGGVVGCDDALKGEKGRMNDARIKIIMTVSPLHSFPFLLRILATLATWRFNSGTSD